MKLNKQQALFLSKVLHHYTNMSDLDLRDAVFTQCADLEKELDDFVTSSDDSSQDKTDFDDGDDDNAALADDASAEKEELVEVDWDTELDVRFLVEDLPKLKVTTVAGDSVSLEFDYGSEGTLDALVDNGSLVIEDIRYVRRVKGAFELHDGVEWHIFKYRACPKDLSELDLDVTYKIVGA